MRIQKENKSWLTISAISIAGLVVLYGLTALATDRWPFNNATEDSSSSQPNVIDDPESDNPSNTTQGSSPTDKTPKQYDTPPDDKTPPDQLTGVINYKQVTDDTLTIRNTIDQSISDGTCNLTLTHKTKGTTVTRHANIIANPSSSTCEGFTIPVSELGSGEWTISIKIQSGDKSGTLTSSVEI